jgi:hypothetical protein
MAKFAGKAYHPMNGSTEDIWEGFSWPCLFLNPIWYLYKGMWGWAVISFLISGAAWGIGFSLLPLGIAWFLLPSSIAWLIFAYFANAQYANSLIERGYLNEEQWQQRLQSSSVTNSQKQRRESSSIADELQKLAKLKEQGNLSDEEFQSAKKKLIG